MGITFEELVDIIKNDYECENLVIGKNTIEFSFSEKECEEKLFNFKITNILSHTREMYDAFTVQQIKDCEVESVQLVGFKYSTDDDYVDVIYDNTFLWANTPDGVKIIYKPKYEVIEEKFSNGLDK